MTTTVEQTKEEFSVGIVSSLVMDLQPVIQETIARVIRTSRATSDAELADQIVTVLRPEILSLIRRNAKNDASYTKEKISRLSERVATSIRPIVLETIRTFRLATPVY